MAARLSHPRLARSARGGVVWALALLAALVPVGCGALRSPCATESCPEGTVCDLDGTCRPLPEPARAAAFSESLGVYATSFSNPEGDRRAPSPNRDRLALGGARDAVIDLTFVVPRFRRNVVEAVLVLFPYERAHTPSATATVAVARMRPSEVRPGGHASPPLPIGRTLSARVEHPSARQALRLDVLGAFDGVAAGDTLALRVRMARGGDAAPWLFASPDALDVALRPRLELLLR